jgi:hypothetical protein
VQSTSKKAKPEKAEPKFPAAPKAASVKPKRPATAGEKSVAAAQLVADPRPTTSPLEVISDLVDNLPLEPCVLLTRRLLTSYSSPKSSNPDDAQEATRGLKMGKASDHNDIPNRAQKHLPMRAVLFLSKSSMRSSAPISFLQLGSTLE